MAHSCTTILICCIDFRLQRETKRWMESQRLLGDCDVASFAGASKTICDGSEDERELLLKQIKIAHDLHHARRIILLHHSDCGAYKNAYQFADAAAEKAKQLADMETAAKIIKERFPAVTVRKVWAQMKDEDGREVKFEEIG